MEDLASEALRLALRFLKRLAGRLRVTYGFRVWGLGFRAYGVYRGLVEGIQKSDF